MLSNMFAIKIWTFVTLFACTAYGQRKPPNYQQNEMPPTSFSCKDKIVGGYYADPETSCQMFHVCVNVVGSGLQDFRFLCPNDTAFDQENQICDDWYNIDCEAATLYYSDNFDLYKLGSGGAQPVTSGKVTPIPLGPSSASPIVQPQAKSRRPPSLSAPVNNAVSENDDDYYLQRSDSSDSKLQHDLLRGSSSGNFFSNRNRGVENPDDYDDAHVPPKKNTKTAPFRKLLTGKKPIAESSSSTGAPSTTETLRWTTTTAAAAPSTTTTVRQPNYKPTTYRSKDRGRVNYKTYLDKQAKPDEYDFQKVAKPAAVTQSAPVSSSFQTTTARANNIVYQTTQINNIAPANQPRNNDFLRIVPGTNNNNNNNGFHSARINAVPVNNNNNFQANNNAFSANNAHPTNNNNNNNNFQANNNAFSANNALPTNNNNNNNNNFQSNSNAFPANNALPTNNNNNNFQVNNVFPANNEFQSNKVFQAANGANPNFQPNNVNYNQGFASDKIVSTTAQYQNPTANAYQTNTFQQQRLGNNNAFQQGNAFQPGNGFQPNNQFQNVDPTTQKYNNAYQQTTNVFQSPTPYNAAGNSFQQQQQQTQTSIQPQFQSTTEHFSKDFKAKFDPYNSYHQRTNEEAGETLRTASSTNLRPSDLNALIQPKPKTINATLSVGFSYNKADGGVAKSTVVVPAVAPTTQKPRPFTTQPTTVQQTTQTRTTVAAVAPSSTKKAVTKDKDSSYDYAYYDDSNHNDYSDVVPEEFSRIQNGKKL